jgi:transaldolase
VKFFLDTANLDEIRTGISPGKVSLSKSTSAKSAALSMAEAGPMVKQGRELAKIHQNVVVKCPLTREGIKAAKELSKDGIRVNVTLCFSAGQALIAAKAGASLRSPTHVIDSALAGSHIGTMPFKVMDMLFNHPLTDKGLEQFLKDWRKTFQDVPAAR